MKTSASSGAIPRENPRSARRTASHTMSHTTGLDGRPHRPWLRVFLRLWLRYRLDACQRSLHAMTAQRENDFHAERLLHRDISAMRSRLQSL